MRSRNIKPGFFKNEDLGELPPLARLLFAGLWCLADREGRVEDRPRKIKAELLPYDNCDVAELLEVLATKGFIRRYRAAERDCLWIPSFREHQNPHYKEAPSILPAPTLPDPCLGISETSPADSRFLDPDSLIPIPDSRIPDPDPRIVDPDPGSGSGPAEDGNEERTADLDELVKVLAGATGKTAAKAGELEAVRQMLAASGGDPDFVKRIIVETARQFRPKHPGDRIVSFKYFVPAVERAAAARAQPLTAAPTDSPPDPARNEALTLELMRLLGQDRKGGCGDD